jgi:putative tricarboxylic transport membrane protein
MTSWSAFRRGEAAIALALLAIAAIVIAVASSMPAGSVALPGPGFFPTVLGILLALVAAAIAAGIGTGEPEARPLASGRETLVTAAGLVGAALLFERIGAIATLAALLGLLFFVLGRLPWWKAAGFGLAGGLVAWAVFARLLGVGLPGPGF